MKLTINTAAPMRRIKDVDAGMLNATMYNVYDDCDEWGNFTIETNFTLEHVKKCLAVCEELGAETVTVSFEFGFADAVVLGKHLKTIGRQALKKHELREEKAKSPAFESLQD